MSRLLSFSSVSPAPPVVTWTFGQKGDASGSAVENSSSSVTFSARGTSDEANIDYFHQSIASGDIELSGIIPAKSSWAGNLVNWAGFGIGITEGTDDSEYFFQLWLPHIGTARNKYGTPPSYTTQVGISDQTPPLYFKITYDDTAKELKAWTSVDDADYFQLGSTISKTLTYPFLVYGFGTSADPVSTTTATITGLSFATSITVTEAADPGNRVGIIHELTVLDDTAGPIGALTDGGWINTFDSTDNSFQNSAQSTFTWDPNWYSTRVDIFVEEGVHGPETDDALRFQIDRSVNYVAAGLNAPRDKFFWPQAGASDRFAYGVQHRVTVPWFLPSSYVSDGVTGRETLWQWATASTSPGMLALVIDQGVMKLLSRTTATSTSGGTEVVEFSQSVGSNLGKWDYITIDVVFDPFPTSTLITSAMGAKAQVGVTYPGTGHLKIIKSIDPGESVTSDDKGTVTNSTGSRADFLICDKIGPIGRVPDWKGGISGQESIVSEMGIYKSGWYGSPPVWPPPAIPHSKSTKDGPIVVYAASARWGDDSSDYPSTHPLQSAEPT